MPSFFFDDFNEDQGRLERLRALTTDLESLNVPALLLEIGSDLATQFVGDKGAFLAGYTRALRDLFFFRQIYGPKDGTQRPPPSFNAVDEMLRRGDITEEEARIMKRNK